MKLVDIYTKLVGSFGLTVNEDKCIISDSGKPFMVKEKQVVIMTPKEVADKYAEDGEYTIIPFNVFKENKIRGIDPLTKKLFNIMNGLQEHTVRQIMLSVLKVIHEDIKIYDADILEVLSRLSATSSRAKRLVDDTTLSVLETLLEDDSTINQLSIRHNRVVNDVKYDTVVIAKNNYEYWETKISNTDMRKKDQRLMSELFKIFTLDKVVAYAKDGHSPDIIAVMKAHLSLHDKLNIYKNITELYVYPEPQISWSDLVDFNAYIKEANMLPDVVEDTTTDNTGNTITEVVVEDEVKSLSEMMALKNNTSAPQSDADRIRMLEAKLAERESSQNLPSNNLFDNRPTMGMNNMPMNNMPMNNMPMNNMGNMPMNNMPGSNLGGLSNGAFDNYPVIQEELPF